LAQAKTSIIVLVIEAGPLLARDGYTIKHQASSGAKEKGAAWIT
jgi:hypothetical protein